MKGEVIDLMECFTANMAFELFLVIMCQSVILIIAFLMKTFATKFAEIGLETGMNPNMSVEG